MTKRSMGPQTSVAVHPMVLVGTYDASGRPNAMAAAWSGIVSSDPPAVGVSVRPARYTHENIVRTNAFTLSIPGEDELAETDFFGIASWREKNKFEATGLTPVRSTRVDAPYVEECPLVLECRLIRTVELGAHTQFVGEIVDLLVDEACLGEDGRPEIARLQPFLYDAFGLGYHRVGPRIGDAFSAGRKFQHP